MFVCVVAPWISPFNEEDRGFGEGEGLRMPLIGFELAEAGADGGDVLFGLEPWMYSVGSLYSVCADHSTFFLARPDPVSELVPAGDVVELALGGVCKLRRGSKGAGRLRGGGRPVASVSWLASRGGVGGLAGSEVKMVVGVGVGVGVGAVATEDAMAAQAAQAI